MGRCRGTPSHTCALNRRAFHRAEILSAVMIGVPILISTKVVNHGHDPAPCGAPVLLAAQPTTNHLHVAHGAEDLPRNEHHFRPGCIEPGGQHTVVAQHADFAALEAIEEVTPRHCARAAADSSGRDAGQVQSSGHFLCMLYGVGEEKNGALGAFPYVLD
jgi:hypothetical protein